MLNLKSHTKAKIQTRTLDTSRMQIQPAPTQIILGCKPVLQSSRTTPISVLLEDLDSSMSTE